MIDSISPGSSSWTKKYFELVRKGEILLQIDRPEGLRKLQFMHLTLSGSGIVFGYASNFIFAKNIDTSNWTEAEKLKFLLFESLLFDYIQTFNNVEFSEDDFLEKATSFYKYHNARGIGKLLSVLSKNDKYSHFEKALKSRTDIKTNLIENKWWVNSLSNVFIYLDVILFDEFIHLNDDKSMLNYSSYASNLLTSIILAIYSDNKIEAREKHLFDVYLASANLDDDSRDLILQRFKKGSKMNDISPFVKEHWLFKRFLFDLSVLTIYYQDKPDKRELQYLENMGNYLNIDQDQQEVSLAVVENFLLCSQDKLAFLQDSSVYDKMYSSVSNRWLKIIGRNKGKITTELKESKELISLIKKSRKQELSPEEKEKIKTQFKDIARTIPSLAIFMVPGGSLLLPLILKIVPDLVPSAFRENTLDDD